MDGSQVWGAYLDGKLREIRSYCETDAANTYLLYLRFQLLRGVYDAAQYQREADLVRATLAKSTEAHWREFLEAWK
jgi:predicted PolB exonuclease-like 3'-5' exonuclease